MVNECGAKKKKTKKNTSVSQRLITLFSFLKFKCCGIRGDDDYINSNWRNESILSVERRNVPLTCCVTQDPGEVWGHSTHIIITLGYKYFRILSTVRDRTQTTFRLLDFFFIIIIKIN